MWQNPLRKAMTKKGSFANDDDDDDDDINMELFKTESVRLDEI
jgi:hypothetical protein